MIRPSLVRIFAASTLLMTAPIPSTTVDSRADHGSPFRCMGLSATIRGSSNGEVIIGTPGRNVIRAGKGGDAVFGGDGVDRICGNKGDDTLHGGNGYDRINGGRGFDTCIGEVVRNCER